MPKLLHMVACENVIFDREDNTASLIILIEGININTQDALPEDAELPTRWCVYTMWRRRDGDEGKTFEQKVEMISPSGRIAKQHDTPFAFQQGKKNHRVKLYMFGLPIGEVGTWSINASLREKNDEAQWDAVASLPFEVSHDEVKSEKSHPENAETS
jgi:hypothetical protein